MQALGSVKISKKSNFVEISNKKMGLGREGDVIVSLYYNVVIKLIKEVLLRLCRLYL